MQGEGEIEMQNELNRFSRILNEVLFIDNAWWEQWQSLQQVQRNVTRKLRCTL